MMITWWIQCQRRCQRLLVVSIALTSLSCYMLQFMDSPSPNYLPPLDALEHHAASQGTTLRPIQDPCNASQWTPQELTDYVAANLHMTYRHAPEVRITKASDHTVRLIQLRFVNTGSVPIPSAPWSITFAHMPNIFEEGLVKWAGKASQEFMKVGKLNQMLYRLRVTPSFQCLMIGGEFRVHFASYLSPHRANIYPNWYVTMKDSQARILKSTSGETLDFVDLYSGQDKHKVAHQGAFRSAAERYLMMTTSDLTRAPPEPLPTPLKTIWGPMDRNRKLRDVHVNSTWSVFAEDGLVSEARLLRAVLGISSQRSQCQGNNYTISLRLLPSYLKISRGTGNEGYSLQVMPSKQQIVIFGQSPAGVFYGIQTLLSLEQTTVDKPATGRRFPEVEIRDGPRFVYRGVMLDVARNFFPKKDLLMILDVMAMYKLNKLHLHLADDQGWRLEIPGLPELTQVGGRRGDALSESEHLLPYLGSGPDLTGLGCGFYTTEEYRQILRHARRNHIEVIPEIDLPGHSYAAIKAMEARYKTFMKLDQPEQALEFLISHPSGAKMYDAGENVINMCRESSYKFVEHVTAALVELHREVAPLRTIHYGGDEVAKVKAEGCTIPNFDPAQNHQGYFIDRLVGIARRYGVKLQMWNEVVNVLAKARISRRSHKRQRTGTKKGQEPPAATVATSPVDPSNITINFWIGRSHNPMRESAQITANGYKVVVSAAQTFYLDQPQSEEPDHRGNSWSNHKLDTRSIFNFSPVENAARPDLPDNILGLEAPLWTEQVRTRDQLEEMLFPRLLALAERSWHPAGWETQPKGQIREQQKLSDWTSFANILGYRELPRLDRLGITYFIPSPGAKFEKGRLRIKTEFPGLPVEYSVDNGTIWRETATDGGVPQGALIRTRSKYAQHYSLPVRIEKPVPPPVVRTTRHARTDSFTSQIDLHRRGVGLTPRAESGDMAQRQINGQARTTVPGILQRRKQRPRQAVQRRRINPYRRPA